MMCNPCQTIISIMETSQSPLTTHHQLRRQGVHPSHGGDDVMGYKLHGSLFLVFAGTDDTEEALPNHPQSRTHS